MLRSGFGLNELLGAHATFLKCSHWITAVEVELLIAQLRPAIFETFHCQAIDAGETDSFCLGGFVGWEAKSNRRCLWPAA